MPEPAPSLSTQEPVYPQQRSVTAEDLLNNDPAWVDRKQLSLERDREMWHRAQQRGRELAAWRAHEKSQGRTGILGYTRGTPARPPDEQVVPAVPAEPVVAKMDVTSFIALFGTAVWGIWKMR